MARGSIPKYTSTRWVPRINQMFACVKNDSIYEGKRREYIDDDVLNSVFRNRNQIRTAQSFINLLLEFRKKYTCPAPGEKYILIKGDSFSLQEKFGADLFDWYLYENGFILNVSVPTEELARYSTIATNFLKVIEDMYIDEYYKQSHKIIS